MTRVLNCWKVALIMKISLSMPKLTSEKHKKNALAKKKRLLIFAPFIILPISTI